MTQQNPFLTDNFKKTWLEHFATKNSSVKSFSYFPELEFVKYSNRPIYINVGETQTKGIGYTIKPNHSTDLKNKTLLIFDVPTYFGVNTSQLGKNINVLKSKQYPGFLINVGKYSSLNDYMLDNFSKNSRNKNNKYKRRLEDSFNISYKMFFGDMSKVEYDFIFEAFKQLLEKRFADKKITNNNLDPKEWSFYYEVAYPLILEKKASLYVIYDNNKPIGVTLSYFSEDILFDAITVFDIDYFKFHLGSVTIMKLIEWCIDNDIKTLDFSKGYFEYKTRWCTKTYDFEYHIYYDSTSFKSKLIASSIKRIYDLKQRLREKNINEKLHKFTYKLRNNKEQKIIRKVTYDFTEVELSNIVYSEPAINFELPENRDIKLMVFEFLYLYQENNNDIRLYRYKSDGNTYLIKGNKKVFQATINN